MGTGGLPANNQFHTKTLRKDKGTCNLVIETYNIQ